MTSEFARGIDAIFRNRFMAVDATYYPAAGRPVAGVRVVKTRASLDGSLAGAGSFRLSPGAQPFALAFEVRVSEVAEPARDDVIVLDGKSYAAREAELVSDGLVWRLTVGAPSDA